jgi:hypothetical protein
MTDRTVALHKAFVEDVLRRASLVLTRAIRGTWHFKLKHGVRTVDTSNPTGDYRVQDVLFLRHMTRRGCPVGCMSQTQMLPRIALECPTSVPIGTPLGSNHRPHVDIQCSGQPLCYRALPPGQLGSVPILHLHPASPGVPYIHP